MCTSDERGKKERGLGEKKRCLFFLLQATLFFDSLHLAACSQANRKIVLSFLSQDASKTNGKKQSNKQDKNETRCSSISPQFFSSSLRAIQIVLPRETDWLDRAGQGSSNLIESTILIQVFVGNRHLLCLLKESGLGLIFHRPPNLPRQYSCLIT